MILWEIKMPHYDWDEANIEIAETAQEAVLKHCYRMAEEDDTGDLPGWHLEVREFEVRERHKNKVFTFNVYSKLKAEFEVLE